MVVSINKAWHQETPFCIHCFGMFTDQDMVARANISNNTIADCAITLFCMRAKFRLTRRPLRMSRSAG